MVSPLISVIIPVHNSEKTLERCVKSVLAQTYTNLECILVDDGSTDGSPALCDALSRRDNRVTVIHQANTGVSEARNAGLRAAAGEWIGFIDSDDEAGQAMYEALLCNAVRYGVLISMCGYEYVINDKRISCSGEKSIKRISFRKAVCYIKKKQYVEGGPWNKLFHRRILQGVFFNNGISFGEDTLFLINALSKTDEVVVSSAPYYVYYQTEGSLSRRYDVHLTDYAYHMLSVYKDSNPFLKRYAQATICYAEYIFAMKKGMWERKRIRKYLYSLCVSGGFSLSTKAAVTLYCISPQLYFKIKKGLI